MKIVAVSDLHLDFVTLGQARFDEAARVLHEAKRCAIEQEADLFLCVGDVADPDSGPVVLRAAREIVSVAMSLAGNAVPSGWVCGNHDGLGDGKTTTLDPLLGLGLDDLVVAVHRPASMTAGYGVAEAGRVLLLPYPSSPAGWPEFALAGELRGQAVPRVVVGHLSIEGVVPGEESGELARGRDVFWPREIDSVAPGALKIGGHYHRRQVAPGGIHVVGSACELTFGERREKGDEPGFVIFELGEVAKMTLVRAVRA